MTIYTCIYITVHSVCQSVSRANYSTEEPQEAFVWKSQINLYDNYVYTYIHMCTKLTHLLQKDLQMVMSPLYYTEKHIYMYIHV